MNLKEGNSNGDFSELYSLLEKDGQTFNNAVSKLVLLILHTNHSHKEELAVIALKLNQIKKNDFVIDLRKIHFQMSMTYVSRLKIK